jgi:steroid 5-alpha reductase family enzyme
MNPRLAHLLMCLYPRTWRERYGVEFEDLLRTSRGDLRTLSNVVWSALCEHIAPTRGHMNQQPRSFRRIAKQASAFVPMAMSLVALALVLVHVGLYGVAREADEGIVAHLWQILMVGQMPIVAFFAIKWLPRAPRQTLGVLALQAGAGLVSMAPVFFLNL